MSIASSAHFSSFNALPMTDVAKTPGNASGNRVSTLAVHGVFLGFWADFSGFIGLSLVMGAIYTVFVQIQFKFQCQKQNWAKESV